MNDLSQRAQGRLIYRKEGAVGWILMSNPSKRNALTFEMWCAFPAILREFAADPEVRLVVLSGDGDDAFAEVAAQWTAGAEGVAAIDIQVRRVSRLTTSPGVGSSRT